MGKDAILHVRIDSDEKRLAEELYDDIGTSLPEAVRMFVRQSVKVRNFPFTPTVSPKLGEMRAKGMLHAYAHKEMRETEREAWIRSLSEEYANLNR